jgi:hypothetical protein
MKREIGELTSRNSRKSVKKSKAVVVQYARRNARMLKASAYVPAYGTITYLHIEHFAQALNSGLWWTGLIAAASLSVLTVLDGGAFLRANAILLALIGSCFIYIARLSRKLSKRIGSL